MPEPRASLTDVPLFHSLPDAEIQHLAASLRQVDAADGEVLVHEGERGDFLFIVTSGQVDVIKALGTPDERLVGMRQPGEFVGEMSLINPDGLRTAALRARGISTLLKMTRDDFDALLERQPKLAFEMLRVLSSRLDQSHIASIHDLQEKNRALVQAYDELRAAQAALIENEILERDLLTARQVQAAMLPQEIPEIDGWRIAAYWQPARQVSGDFYDFFPLPGGHWGFLVADVTDKGMPSALVMASTRAVLRAVVTDASAHFESQAAAGGDDPAGMISPGWLLTRANNLLTPDMALNMFVTCLLVVIDPTSGELRLGNAGHNLPYLRSAHGVQKLHATGLPLGIFSDFDYEDTGWIVQPGESLLMYSDGLVEAHDPQGDMCGYLRLQESLEYCTGEVPLQGEELIQYLMGNLLEFTGPGWEQEDDVTLLTLERISERD